jgi:phosphopantetheine adenylyltransferase
MGQTTILEENFDHFNSDTGEINRQVKHTIKKNNIEPTDEFIKVSKYLNTIFAYNNIPLNLVPISLLIAQEMEFKTNKIYLLKPIKEEFAQMLDISLDRVNKLIKECQKYNIIRPLARGIYEVNSYLYSTGSIVETRQLQAHFDFDNDTFITTAEQTNYITGKVVKKAVMNKKTKQSSFPGQIEMNFN